MSEEKSNGFPVLGVIVLALIIASAYVLWIMFGYIARAIDISYRQLKLYFSALTFALLGLILVYAYVSLKERYSSS